MLACLAAVNIPSTSGASQGCPGYERLQAIAGHVHARRADLDGDGHRDQAWLLSDRHAPSRCRYFLAARTRAGFSASSLHSPLLHADAASRLPSLDAIIRVAPGRYAQLLVRLTQGASQSGGNLYTFTGTGFRPLPILHSPQTLFLWGSAATILDGVDCLHRRMSGAVVQLQGGEIGSSGTKWSLERTVFRLGTKGFSRSSQTTTAFHGTLEQLVRTLPAAGGLPFPTCAAR